MSQDWKRENKPSKLQGNTHPTPADAKGQMGEEK